MEGKMKSEEQKATTEPCRCPYCQGETTQLFPFCSLCGVQLNRCLECGCVLEIDAKTCPRCGAQVKVKD